MNIRGIRGRIKEADTRERGEGGSEGKREKGKGRRYEKRGRIREGRIEER